MLSKTSLVPWTPAFVEKAPESLRVPGPEARFQLATYNTVCTRKLRNSTKLAAGNSCLLQL